MNGQKHLILHRHHLKHLPELKVEPDFLTRRFAPGCSMAQCNARCCRQGVMVDIAEQKHILDQRALVLKYMEPHQEHDPDKWFDGVVEEDTDFPSGKGVGTQVRSTGCVFLDSVGRCVLQKAAIAEGMNKFALKPFFCVAYPVTIESGTLIIDDADFTERKECCSTVENGTLTVLDVCREELEFMLGPEGLSELQAAHDS